MNFMTEGYLLEAHYIFSLIMQVKGVTPLTHCGNCVSKSIYFDMGCKTGWSSFTSSFWLFYFEMLFMPCGVGHITKHQCILCVS